jgi:hypothetical protein
MLYEFCRGDATRRVLDFLAITVGENYKTLP